MGKWYSLRNKGLTTFFHFNHNYNKIFKFIWLSAALIYDSYKTEWSQILSWLSPIRSVIPICVYTITKKSSHIIQRMI